MKFAEDDNDKFNFRDMTLHQALGMIIPDDVRLPKDKRIARLMFSAIMKKFNSCKRQKEGIQQGPTLSLCL